MAITYKKIKLALILMAVSYSNFSLAQISPQEAGTLQENTTLENALQENSLAEASPSILEKNGMVWSLMPGESVNRLARLFYPKNKAMQQLFVTKTLYLSRKIQPNLHASTTANTITLVVIPDIKQLSKQSIPPATSKNYNSTIRLMQEKSQTDVTTALINSGLQFDFDKLIKKNEFLKVEIEKINARLAYLEQVFVTLKSEILRLVERANANADSAVNTKLNPEVALQQPGQLNANLAKNQKSKALELTSKPILTPVTNTKATQVKSSYDSSYLFLSIFNLILVISCLVGFVLFTRRQVMSRGSTASNFEMTKSDEIRKKSLMIKNKLDSQKKIKILKVNTPVVGEFKHSMPGADIKPEISLAAETSPVVSAEVSPDIAAKIPETASRINVAVTPEVNAKVIAAAASKVEATEMPYDREEAELLLGQAKVFVQVDRAGYAIRLLKAQIQAAPKASLQHWLYLLDIYRETNQKEEFLEHAKQLHQNFNVMMPLWENTPLKMVIASSLEEFSHITAKVTKLWADCKKEANSITQTKAYLDELLTDNRDSQRSGFSMEVFQEIMTLRNLLDEREKQTEEEIEAY